MLIGIFNPMGAQSDRLRCEVCQNLFLSPMNTGLLRPAVATALTVYGIETSKIWVLFLCGHLALQQHLPFTVLKQPKWIRERATSLVSCNSTYRLRYWNVIENLDCSQRIARCNSTYRLRYWNLIHPYTLPNVSVATALTVYGIETRYLVNAVNHAFPSCNSTYHLRYWNCSCLIRNVCFEKLEQYLPFIVF